MEVQFRLLEQFPGYRNALMKLEHATARRLRSAEAARTTVSTIHTIVHVVYHKDEENISDAQVKSQIKILNEDFRAKNADRTKTPTVWSGLVADSMIEFKLEDIKRFQTPKTSFGSSDDVKSAATGGVDAIDTDKKLNIWVCRLKGSLLGYAQFPGGPAATDGVVIRHSAFGNTGTAADPFNLGRTATHEVGHYFNLRHIWGDTPDCSGSDFVDDTPNAEGPNNGKPTFPSISCSNGPSGDMFMNYMDYCDDDSLYMFTKGQVARMHAALDGPRSGLVE